MLGEVQWRNDSPHVAKTAALYYVQSYLIEDIIVIPIFTTIFIHIIRGRYGLLIFALKNCSIPDERTHINPTRFGR